VTFTDNIRQLEALSHFGVVPADTAQWLMAAYRGYRAVLHRLSLEGGGLEGGGTAGAGGARGGERVVDAAAHAATRARIRAIWQETFGETQ